MIESEQPEPPAWLTPDSDGDSESDSGSEPGSHRAGAAGSRQTLLLVGGGAVILVLVAGLAAFGLYSASADTARPRPKSAATDPVVLVPTGPADPNADPAAEAAPATPTATPAKTTPAAAKTTVAASPGKSQVTAASITIEPASASGPCPRSTRYIRVTMKVTITVSVPEVRLRYTVDGGKELGTTMRSKTYTDSWEANAKREAGTYTSVLKVTAPSAASDTATFKYTCD
ncbi:hypothetical protein AB0K00_07535 [Dactylosporangium sp. NPDC049525]|uniref:hypothetical protein n=1 Tax=Dactylosporangium sp. NPDC049525 TaxID=3154730 RepID=UPI0034460C20